MHSLFLPLVLIAAASAATDAEVPPVPEPQVSSFDNPAYSAPATKWVSVDDAVAQFPEMAIEPLFCRDTINKARAEAGKPPLLGREAASPDKPLAIYAVDRRENGCSVMVMKGDPSDIRPLPAPMEGPLRAIPAEADGK